MRNAFCDALVPRCGEPGFVFLTGDLGYGALESLRDRAGDRFINAGIAEQNMVSMAAGLARTGLSPWVYSIAPFLYARPLEQIRNDVCFHDLPVKLAGNGGGYAYGVMGSSHHALEDYGILLTLPNMRVFVPAFREDIEPIISKMARLGHPCYLRLGRDEKPKAFPLPRYSGWRKVTEGGGAVLLVAGPLAGTLLDPLMKLPKTERPSTWVVSELPFDAAGVPPAFFRDLGRSKKLTVVEEHVAHGGVGEMMARCLMLRGGKLPRFTHHFAGGYPSGFYGSQQFHRKESGLDPAAILKGLTR